MGIRASPKGNNAIYYYRQALTIEPDNEAALTGLQRVVTEYIALANKSFNRKDYGTGLRHVRIGLELAPTNQELLGLKEQYKHRSNALKRFINNVFN